MKRRTRATADSWPSKPMPPQQKSLPLQGSYSRAEYSTISMGLVPRTPQDLWFIYLQEPWLHFHRSRTGTCIYQLRLVPVDDHYAAVELIVNRLPEQYRNTDDVYDVELVSHLVDRLLLGRFSAFPQPGNLSETDRQRHKKHVMGEDSGSIDLDVLNNGKK